MLPIHLRIALASCLLTSFLASMTWGQFVHPGVAHTSQSIAFVKEKLAAEEKPWVDEWNRLSSSKYSSLDWQPNPVKHVERGPYNRPDIGSSEFSDDGWAAYCHAVCWAVSGKEAHAKKAAEILNAWSNKLEKISDHDARLLIGMSGYNYVVAAELTKHTWDGWPEEEQSRFETMLRKVFYPQVKDFYGSANGNWDAAMMEVMIAMGVFLDDKEIFDRATNYFLNGDGNGAIGNYFMESGECQESGRDQAHTQMGLDFLANTAETAWIQGVDLYSALDNRLLKGFEYTAKHNLGYKVPYVPYESVDGRYLYKTLSNNSRGRLRPMYERVYNHYHNRMGLETESTEYTEKAAMKLRYYQESDRRRRRRRSSRRQQSAASLDAMMYAGEPAKPKSKDKKMAKPVKKDAADQ